MVRILLVDDHGILREGLCALLGSLEKFEVVGEASDGTEAVELAQKLQPDLVLLDTQMPKLNGIDACRAICECMPKTHVLALSMHSDWTTIKEMIHAGAAGYVLKGCDLKELLDAMEGVLKGENYLPKDLELQFDEKVTIRPTDLGPGQRPPLSPREREVLQHVAAGKTTRQIAEMLDVSVKTIETHRHNLMQKLNLYSVADLTRHAIKIGLVALDRR